jgi:hypothetical protein
MHDEYIAFWCVSGNGVLCGIDDNVDTRYQEVD